PCSATPPSSLSLPTPSRTSPTKISATSTKSAKPAATAISRRPAATAATYWEEHGTATARRITPSAKSPQHSRNDDQHDHENDEEPDVRSATTMLFGNSFT